MNFELEPVADEFRNKKNLKESEPEFRTHISAKPISVKAAQNPWQGRYDRRAVVRDQGLPASIPVLANDRSRKMPNDE